MSTNISIPRLDPQEVTEILQRIDENIAMRAALQPATTVPDTLVLNLPLLQHTAERIHRLYAIHAPFFVAKGSLLTRTTRNILNLPLRILARKQAFFNNEAMQIATETVSHAQAMQNELLRVIEYIAHLEATINDLSNSQNAEQEYIQILESQLHQLATEQQSMQQHLDHMIAEQKGLLEQIATDQHGQYNLLEQVATNQRGQHNWLEQLATDQRGQHDWLEQLATDQRGQHDWLEQLVTDQRGQHNWLEQLATDQRGQHDWVTTLQRKQEMLALDVREQSSHKKFDEIPQPRIINPEQYEAKVRALGAIRLNLGCGEKPLEQYINVDYRPVPDVDIIADVHALPYEVGTVSEIASAHLVEHFRKHEFRTHILSYWISLLQPGGCLRIICPNWEAIVKHLNEGQLNWEQFRLLTFGGQDYIGDDHFAMYTPATLGQLLEEAGLQRIEVLVSERMNGICPEMEIVAFAP